MSHNKDLTFFHSKSTAVADSESGHDGFGGRISADQPTFLVARPLAVITGVAITAAVGKNTDGTGSLKYVDSAKTLEWQAPRDSAYGATVNVSAGGTFELESVTTDAWIRVTVTALDLPMVDKIETVILDSNANILFDDIPIAEAMAGTPNYRCFFLKNIGAVTYKEIHPKIELPGTATTVKASTFYPQSGQIRLNVTSASGWPNSHYVRNRRTREIMYYASRGGGDGNELVVPNAGRRRRGTSSAEGIAGDAMELVAPIDIFIETYNPASGAAVIVRDDLPPAGATFFYPDPSDFTHYVQEFSLTANSILTVWLKRNVIPGAAEIVDFPYRLGFQYSS